MNEKALKELLELVSMHVDHAHWTYDEWAAEYTCFFCGYTVPDTDDACDLMEDECGHEDTCAWRLMKEAYANLDNPGY